MKICKSNTNIQQNLEKNDIGTEDFIKITKRWCKNMEKEIRGIIDDIDAKLAMIMSLRKNNQ